jgi:hypothetical protein
MSTTADRQQNYITTARNAAQDLWRAQQVLLGLQAEWNAQDYANTLSDGEGANAGITAVMIGMVVFDSANAIETVMLSGVATNITNVLE